VKEKGMLKKNVKSDEELVCWTGYQCTTNQSVEVF